MNNQKFFPIEETEFRNRMYFNAAESTEADAISAVNPDEQADTQLDFASCLGSAGSLGTFGTGTGCLGTAGTAGTYGCGRIQEV
ncbi:MAG: hypothetical protein AAFP19_26205 [Bacteroidota bacterium]